MVCKKGFCRESAGREKSGMAPAQGGLQGRTGSGSAGLGWEGLAAAGRDCMEFAVWNSRVPVVPWGKGSRGEDLQGH